MTLADRLIRQGQWLFRRRSFLPLALLPLGMIAAPETAAVEARLGPMGTSAWDISCLLVALAGLAIRCLVVGRTAAGTSGRNTAAQRATILNTTGFYSVVRHPLYLANFVVYLGVVLLFKSAWFTAVFALSFALYYERIMLTEEAFLAEQFGEEFRRWASCTPAFFPRLADWKPADRPFSPRKVLRQEHAGFYAVVVSFFLFEVAMARFFPELRGGISHMWTRIFFAGTAIFVTMQFLKKHTKILNPLV